MRTEELAVYKKAAEMAIKVKVGVEIESDEVPEYLGIITSLEISLGLLERIRDKAEDCLLINGMADLPTNMRIDTLRQALQEIEEMIENE